ncbi:MAG TPA: DCC1-like thiol-disulfide oxidoreductase family protein [Polyangia bacterium]|nr:DCC1-like thiol-disulfide oxidoreductase family protein [Polyangia bacterium]
MADLVLYDGVCGLCNRLVQFILRRDRRDRFRYASLQSDLAQELLRRHGRDALALDTVSVVRAHGEPDERVLTKARAIIYVAGWLGLPWALAGFLKIFPWRLLDFVYDQIAHRRYRWFGRYDACPLPAPATRAKFLDASG